METELFTDDQSPETAYAEEDSDALPNLPQEIIIEILSWLPVNSLLRFRCVSKSWLRLISNPQFVKTHLERSKNSSKHARHNVLLSFFDAFKIYSCSLYPLLYENSPVNAVEQDLHIQGPNSESYCVGCCDGLFCMLEGSDNLILWNPSTRKYWKLPDSGLDRSNFICVIYGFGYDETHDDYKVVEKSCFSADGFGAKVSVYSLKSNSWRRIQDYTSGCVVAEPGVFFNGALHYSVARYDNSRLYWSIISFDVAEETYGEIPLHELIGGNVGWRIGILEGCLSVSYRNHEARTEVWILKEYNVKESWTKLFTIPSNFDFGPYVTPIITRDNGKVLLMSGKKMMVYSPQDNTSKKCDIHAQGACLLGAAVPYIESLISPDRVGN